MSSNGKHRTVSTNRECHWFSWFQHGIPLKWFLHGIERRQTCEATSKSRLQKEVFNDAWSLNEKIPKLAIRLGILAVSNSHSKLIQSNLRLRFSANRPKILRLDFKRFFFWISTIWICQRCQTPVVSRRSKWIRFSIKSSVTMFQIQRRQAPTCPPMSHQLQSIITKHNWPFELWI